MDEPTTDECLKRAVAALGSRDYYEAAVWYQQCFAQEERQDQRSVYAFNVGACLEALGIYEAAADWFRLASEASPTDPVPASAYRRLMTSIGKARRIEALQRPRPHLPAPLPKMQQGTAELRDLDIVQRASTASERVDERRNRQSSHGALRVDLPDGTAVSISVIYHITHIENLPAILRDGLLSLNEMRRRKSAHTSIAEEKVQHLRDRVWIESSTGSPPVNLHDYVPFYFVPKTPMLFRRLDQQDGIVLIEVTADVLRRPGTLFTDGNASVQGLSHRHPNVTVSVRVSTQGEHCQRTFWEDDYPRPWRISRAVSEVYSGLHNLGRANWDVLRAAYWSNHEDGRRQRCAEILLRRQVALEDFRRLVVSNHDLLERVRAELSVAGASIPAECLPGHFFPRIAGRADPSLAFEADDDLEDEVDPDDLPF